MVWMECTACLARADTLPEATLSVSRRDESLLGRRTWWWICLECDQFVQAKPSPRSWFHTMLAGFMRVLEEFAAPPPGDHGRDLLGYPALPWQTVAVIWWVS